MTLQSSGQISLDDVRTEFGDSGEVKLSDYYGAEGGLPASGEVTLSDFYSITNLIPFLTNRCTGTGGFNQTLYAGWRFTTDGKLQRKTGLSTYVDVLSFGWETQAPIANAGDNFEIRADNTGSETQAGCVEALGSFTDVDVNGGDNTGVWLPLTSNREWFLTVFIIGGLARKASINVDIRNSQTQVIEASGNYTMTVYDAS